jgi:hypothetical protein
VDRDEILRVLRAFEASGLEYVLIGATAMGFRSLIRATEDVDLFIRATPEDVERLRAALRAASGHDPHIEEITSEDLLGAYPAIRYFLPTGDLYIDVMTRLGELASFENVASEVKAFEGTRLPVATPATLYRLKKGTVRAGTARTPRPCGGLTCRWAEVPFDRGDEPGAGADGRACGLPAVPPPLRALLGDGAEGLPAWRLQVSQRRGIQQVSSLPLRGFACT